MEGKVRCEHCIMSRDAKGNWVFHTDHLRAVTLAKIEVLEEMLSRLGGYSNSTKGYCEAKIAALRKEIG